MAVSSAFKELAVALSKLEADDRTVEKVEIDEAISDDSKQISAELTVSIPVLESNSFRKEVAIDSDMFKTRDGRVAIDLSISMPMGEDGMAEATIFEARDTGRPAESTSGNGLPKYKEPDALRAVYEEHNSFPKMTEALGVDVTPETVRRHMIEYDIHDPGADETTGSNSVDANTPSIKADNETQMVKGSDIGVSEDSAADAESTGVDGNGNAPINDAMDANSSHSDATDDESPSIMELLATNDGGAAVDSLVTDGLGVPGDLTVADLTAIVNESRTIHEASQRLNVNKGTARKLLKELELIDFVSHRLASGQIEISENEVVRRITRPP